MEIAELAVLVGEIRGGVTAVQKAQEDQAKNIGKIFDRIDKLPCASHDESIDALQTWKKTCNGTSEQLKVEQAKGGISLKNTLIIVAVTNIFTLAISIITTLISRGAQ